MRWAVEGHAQYLEQGLAAPLKVRDATASYFTEQDRLGRFLDQFTKPQPDGTIGASDLYADYVGFVLGEGEKPEAQRRFGAELKRRGFATVRRSAGVRYVGLARVEADINNAGDHAAMTAHVRAHGGDF